ncbi:MAG: hypothetical protein ABEI99_04960 [Halobaculum sp.]
MTNDAPPHVRGLPRLSDADFLYGGFDGEQVQAFHDAGIELFTELDDYTGEDSRYFVLGSYETHDARDGPKDRLVRVCAEIDESRFPARGFRLDELDEDGEHWLNFYLKFRYTLIGTDYSLVIAESNDGGHELELGEVPKSELYVLKRDYSAVSLDSDVEYEKFDAMMATLFTVLDENGHLSRWTSESELVDCLHQVLRETRR